MVKPNKSRFLDSLAAELFSQSRRVRDLIGDKHWLSDGHHKESLLRDFLVRHVPAGMALARGFVVSPTDMALCSTEQDILVLDLLTEPPIFYQGGLAISFPRSVAAAISVKTTMKSKEVVDSVSGLNSVRNICNLSGESHHVWCGSYHFELGDLIESNNTLPYKYMEQAMKDHAPIKTLIMPEHPLAVGPDVFCSATQLAYECKYIYKDETRSHAAVRLKGFDCQGTATALFISSLLEHLATRRNSSGCSLSLFLDDLKAKQLTPAEQTFEVAYAA